jgi:hypothetical protein
MNCKWKTKSCCKPKDYRKEKTLFKSYYCSNCKQRKPCGKLNDWDSEWKSYCCHCYYESEQVKAEEYSNYQQVYQRKEQERQKNVQQYQLLKDYLGCPKCRSKEVDAYHLYNENKLICQPCLMKKEGSSTSPSSFSEQNKWYKRYWKIDLTEWLKNFSQLPVNKNCADQWIKNKRHLEKCVCLEKESKECLKSFICLIISTLSLEPLFTSSRNDLYSSLNFSMSSQLRENSLFLFSTTFNHWT